ncbi:hypothetical protein [Pontibacter beigongshangensis]|uniref:hypothetical protein n=1 Tax=Pontibacter beigongshangensis TaxID=2574733 RepID=UPI00164F778C|nr:hypothetical protein [Pontibacter beigongshangensis]
MSISRRVTDGQEELIIRNEPQITEAVLGALIELLKAIPDVSDLQATLVQMETICVKYASDEFTLWEEEQKQLLFLHEFLRKIRFRQSGDTIE